MFFIKNGLFVRSRNGGLRLRQGRSDRGVGVGPLVAEQFGRLEGLQGGEMLLPVGDEEAADDAARQPVGAFADRRNVAGQLAVAQRRREVEAVDLAEAPDRRRASSPGTRSSRRDRASLRARGLGMSAGTGKRSRQSRICGATAASSGREAEIDLEAGAEDDEVGLVAALRRGDDDVIARLLQLERAGCRDGNGHGHAARRAGCSAAAAASAPAACGRGNAISTRPAGRRSRGRRPGCRCR